MTKKRVPTNHSEHSHAMLVPAIIIGADGKHDAWMCSVCRTAWYDKEMYDSCPLCSAIFDGEVIGGEPERIYTRGYKEKKKAEEKEAKKESKSAEEVKAKPKKRGRKKKEE